METIQEKYPDAEICFIIGADKLSSISRWHRNEEFLQRFHILAVDRDDILPDETVLEHPFLQKYADSFRLLREPDDIENISSTRARELLRNGDESVAQMVHPAVWELLLNDIDAVECAVSYEWSNGFVEGTNNRVKMVKRTMFGRCSRKLLETKILLFPLCYC